MKKITLLVLIFSGPLFSKNTVPITVEVNSLVNSNIDRVSNPVKEDVYSQTLFLKSKFKFKPFKKFILVDLPSLDLEHTPSLQEKTRNLSINNTLLGLYLPQRGLIYTTSLIANYTKSIFTNEDQEVEADTEQLLNKFLQ